MKICIYGAGAIGGLIGFRLAENTAAEVSFVARGKNLDALKEQGLKLVSDGESAVTRNFIVSDSPQDLGTQDYVIVAVKANAAADIVEPMQPLLGDHTAVVSAVNGVPWWYFYKLEGDWQDCQLATVDPDGRQWQHIGPERAIGCVVYPAAELTAPGEVRHVYGERLIIGEPDGCRSERVKALSNTLIEAGFKAPVRNIRDEIWVKLWGNLCFNPISALTTATLDVIATDPDTRAVAVVMMEESREIGEKLGVQFKVDIDKRIDGAASVGAHKTSMLQDLERGGAMEIDALLGAVQEIGKMVGVDTPAIDIVLGLVKQRARVAGCYSSGR